MDWLLNLVRRARLRSLVDGRVQTARAESLDDQAHDAAERHQDYGFAANPVDGQGLVMHIGGHTLVLRMDRLAERPELAAYEVALWHKEGHRDTLKAGKLVEVSCDHLVINAATDVVTNSPSVTVNASTSVQLNTPTVAASDDVTVGGTLTAAVEVIGDGTRLHTHRHTDVKAGSDTSGPPA